MAIIKSRKKFKHINKKSYKKSNKRVGVIKYKKTMKQKRLNTQNGGSGHHMKTARIRSTSVSSNSFGIVPRNRSITMSVPSSKTVSMNGTEPNIPHIKEFRLTQKHHPEIPNFPSINPKITPKIRRAGTHKQNGSDSEVRLAAELLQFKQEYPKPSQGTDTFRTAINRAKQFADWRNTNLLRDTELETYLTSVQKDRDNSKEQLPFRDKISLLNTARNAFKHYKMTNYSSNA